MMPTRKAAESLSSLDRAPWCKKSPFHEMLPARGEDRCPDGTGRNERKKKKVKYSKEAARDVGALLS